MKLWVGLGNPDLSMRLNRHNAGFLAVDEIARFYNFPSWRYVKKFSAEISEATIDGEKVILAKPQTYMNLSGDSVQKIVHFYKLTLDDIIVFHDDLDLNFGKLKIKKGGGAAGHNGLRSIDKILSNKYWRVRLGIGHPGDKNLVTNYVLGDFSSSERTYIHQWFDDIASYAGFLVKGENDLFMSKLLSC